MLYAAVGDTYATASVSQDSFSLPDLRGTSIMDFSALFPWYLRVLPRGYSGFVLGRPSVQREIETERANGGKPEIRTTPLVWVVKAR